MSAYALLNLLNELWKKIRCEALPGQIDLGKLCRRRSDFS